MATAPETGRTALTTAACALAVALFAVALNAVTAGGRAWTFEDERRLRAAQHLLAAGPAVVETSAGESRTLWDGRAADTVFVVDFFYASCESVCSALGAIYTQMQSEMDTLPRAVRDRVALVSISFDPKDDAAALRKYASTHQADPLRWTVARPADAAQQSRLLQDVRIVAIPDGRGGFVHNGALHVMDGHGRVLEIHDYDQWREAFAAAVRRAGGVQP